MKVQSGIAHALRGLCVAMLLANAPVARAADTISIMVGGVEKQIYLPFLLADKLGYFKDEGLTVEVLSQPAGVDAENEMLAGAVQGVGGFYDHCIDLQAKGKFVESIIQLARTPGEVELVSTRAADVHTAADLKGKSLGVTGLGSSTNFLTQYIVVRQGLKPGEYSVLPVGAGTTFIAAMKQDKIQAGMTTEPTITRLVKSGDARVLVDLRSPDTTRAALGGLYPATALYMPNAWVEKHKKEARKLVNALKRTLVFIKDHSAAEIADVVPKDYYAGDKAGYIEALSHGKIMFTDDGIMPEGGPETVLAVLAGSSKTITNAKIDLSKTFTTKFVKKRDKDDHDED